MGQLPLTLITGRSGAPNVDPVPQVCAGGEPGGGTRHAGRVGQDPRPAGAAHHGRGARAAPHQRRRALRPRQAALSAACRAPPSCSNCQPQSPNPGARSGAAAAPQPPRLPLLTPPPPPPRPPPRQYDGAVVEALDKRVTAKATFKGQLDVYRYCDNVRRGGGGGGGETRGRAARRPGGGAAAGGRGAGLLGRGSPGLWLAHTRRRRRRRRQRCPRADQAPPLPSAPARSGRLCCQTRPSRSRPRRAARGGTSRS